jgi:hypothetical protein
VPVEKKTNKILRRNVLRTKTIQIKKRAEEYNELERKHRAEILKPQQQALANLVLMDYVF